MNNMFENYFLYNDAQCPICASNADGLKDLGDGVLWCPTCFARFQVKQYSMQSTNLNAGVYIRDESAI